MKKKYMTGTDIDGHQIDKILVTDLGPQEEETEEVEE